MKTTLTLAALTTLLLGSVALAHGNRGHGFARYDQNGDGQLTLDEARKASDLHFQELDQNNDGRITADELEAHREQKARAYEAKRAERKAKHGDEKKHEGKSHRFAKHAEKFFAKLDQNGDGVIDRSEMQAASERRFARMDKNGDGVVTADELRGGRHGKWGGKEKHQHDAKKSKTNES